MRNIYLLALRSGALVLTVLACVNTAVAQPERGNVLNSLERRQLVERGLPADHNRLADHVRTLAERYSAEAKRHTSMAAGFGGNPSRNVGLGLATHCKRLAELNTASATTLRELVEHHEKLAAGQSSTPPPDGAGFMSGRGASAPTDEELRRLAETARTAADHRRLAEYFVVLANRYTTEAEDHLFLASNLRGPSRAPTAGAIAAHCDRLAAQLRAAANEASGAASRHKQLGSSAK